MFSAQLEDYFSGGNPVRVIDFFVDQLGLGYLGFSTVDPKETGRPAYHPAAEPFHSGQMRVAINAYG